MIRTLVVWIGLVIPAMAYAHPGGRDAEGCHICRSKCERYDVTPDVRHCHGVKRAEEVKPAEKVPAKPKILELGYEGFTIWLDCEKRGAVAFRYNAQRDTGQAARSSSFRLDPDVPKECQQRNGKSYKTRPPLPKYDRGHLVPANHLDFSQLAIKQSNFMTNILPQVLAMNRGAWKHTEDIIECRRDTDELLVFGGVFWEPKPDRNPFLRSHGITIPPAFWKVLVRGSDGEAIAWIIPNSVAATYDNLDQYLVPIREIEQRLGGTIPVVEDFRKDRVPEYSWQVPLGCDRS